MGYTIARVVAAIMLLAALGSHPYAYYSLLRWIVCGVAAYGALRVSATIYTGWAWTLGIIALLFNPVLPVYLTRSMWAPIDVVAAIILLVSIPSLNLTGDKVDSIQRQETQMEPGDNHVEDEEDDGPLDSDGLLLYPGAVVSHIERDTIGQIIEIQESSDQVQVC